MTDEMTDEQLRKIISTSSADNFSVTITAGGDSILSGSILLYRDVAQVCLTLQGGYRIPYPPCPKGREQATKISARAELKLDGEHVEAEVLFKSCWLLKAETRAEIQELLQPFASLLIGRVLEALDFCRAEAKLETILGEL